MSSDFLDRISRLSPQRLALLALELHEKLEATQAHEPIAICGIGCRFPGGADDPQAFWQLLREGRDAVRDVPPERWDIDARFDPDPDAPGRMSVRNGAFLNRVDGFDAAFFGIAPREAQTMDPQQRLVLEVAWEALEHAGIAPAALAGSATGVFVGVCNSDHFQRVLERGDAAIDAYLASGNAHSVVSGRIAYFLNLRGPAVSIDTACSSSLVALHMAMQSLRSGEVRVALAGGVNVMCSPQTTIALTKAHMLAPDGRCKTFDAAADGFARGEGCGMLVLKRLADAQADGDRVLALVRGSASNQDGRSGGLTVPSGPAQEAVIRAALADARLTGADIDYVEAHGTGTTLGDPIEVRALGAALCDGRTADTPLRIGSVKTNIGHLESAAGVAGVIKVVLSLLHERVPAHLHFKTPSPHIDWQRHPVEVCADGFAWPRGAKPRRAGVSSFGFSGTNAHVVLEEAPPAVAADPRATPPVHVLPLSARSGEALAQLARRYLLVLNDATSAADLADIAASAGSGRSHMAQRAAVVAADVATARAALQALACGETHEALHVGTALPGQATEFAFLFTGQGAQYAGMSMRLYALAPDFAAVIDRCDAHLGPDAQGRTLKSVLVQSAAADDDAPIALQDTAWTQPALFAVELALTEVWKRWGITPAAAIGHSMGEYAAACAAGVFTLEDGLSLIAERGRLMQALPPGGTMAALYASADEVQQAVAASGGGACIAAFNAADSVVVAGAAAAVDGVLARMVSRGVQGHRLHVALAAHSPWVEPALAGLEAAASRVPMNAPTIPVAWNVTGAALPGGAPDAAYWRRHLREPVRFADGLRWLADQGFRHFIEVGPHPTLAALAERSLPDANCIASMRRGKDDWDVLMHALAAAYVAGAAIDWAAVQRPYGARRVALPTYPFERQSYWVDTAVAPPVPPQHAAASTALRGRRLPHALPSFELVLRPDALPWLGQHRLHGAALVAGPVFVEIAAKAAAEVWGGAPAVCAFDVHAPLVVPDDGVRVQVHFVPLDAEGDAHRFEIHSRAAAAAPDAAWSRHASGLIALGNAAPQARPALRVAQLAKDLGAPASCAPHYQRLRDLGIELGPVFVSLQEAHRRDGEVLARLQLTDEALADEVALAHPGLLDGALQAAGLALPPQPGDGSVYLLAGVQALRWGTVPLPPSLWCHARLRDGDGDPHPTQWLADVTLHDDRGAWVGALEGVMLRRAARESLQRIAAQAQTASARDAVGALGYDVAWEPAPVSTRAARCLVPPTHHAAGVAARFEALAAEHGLAVYDTLLPQLDRLSASYVALALRQLGFADVPGRWLAADTEARALGVVAPQRRLFARLLQMLAEDGILAAQGTGYAVCGRLEDVTAAQLAARHDALLKQHAPVDGELSMLRRCGEHLARVLRGEQDPLQLLFPGGSFAEARKLYVESPYARTYNGALAAAIIAATARLPAHAHLRVLEIGAGTGGTTAALLPLLDAARTDYMFTDLSPLFLERAAETFGAYPFVKRQLLDIERDPATQGFANGRYDIVIAANVLHACADLGHAVRHARSLLADGGQLLLLEGLVRSRWVDLSFGLTDGWWRFTDAALRADYPLIARPAWQQLLEQNGYDSLAMHPQGGGGARAQQALIVARAAAPVRRWHLAGGPQPIVRALQQRLEALGHAVSTAGAGELPAGTVDACVYLGALEATPLEGDAQAIDHCESHAVLNPLAQLAHAARGDGRVWLVTQGVQRLRGDAATPGARWSAPLWGLARVFALEHPQRWGGVIDLPPAASADIATDALLRSFEADDDEDQVAWRGGMRHAARLIEQPLAPTPAPALRADATYLVTGGFGGLGLQLAAWLADQGVRHLALLGRRPDVDAPALQALRARGVQVLAIAADVADPAQVSALPQQLLTAHAPPLAGIFHLAADLGATPISELGAAQVRTMLRPKVAGTLALQALARTHRIELLVLFSTTTALLGAAGLAHYAAANAFLDASAEHAEAGAHTLSINWGTWEAMRLASVSEQQHFRAAGLLPMRNADALAAMGRLLGARATRGVVAAVDWPQLKGLHEARRARPLLRRVGAAEHTAPKALNATPAAPAHGAAQALIERVRAAPAALRRDVMIDFVQTQVSAVLALPASSSVALHTGLFDLGMDSLMAVELKRRLERGVGKPLPSTLTFNYPNVGALALFLDNQLADTLVQAGAPDTTTATSARAAAPPAAAPASELDALSDAELETRLLAALEKAR